MKFILTDSNTIRINLHKGYDTLAEEIKETDISLKEVLLIKDKMKSIVKNIDTVKKTAKSNADNSRAVDSTGKSLKDREQKEIKELDKIEIIELDTSWAMDEFLFRYADDSILPNSCCSIEVVTKEVAEGNDKDFDATTEEDYKVGEGLSYYRKLGDSGYYFRFL